jgi:hypothetical protein
MAGSLQSELTIAQDQSEIKEPPAAQSIVRIAD